jgi:hypothetical protein
MFEPIDTTGFKPTALRDQPQPMLLWVEIDTLVIDRRYQRDLTPKGRSMIQRMANDWDWRKYQPILVAPAEDGTLAIVDGQHRAHAAALVGLEKIPAMTVAMTLQEQATGFAAVNRDRVGVSMHQIYRAELAAGAEWAVACRDAVAAAGCKLATSNNSTKDKKPGTIYAIGLIRRMVRNGEASAVTNGLAAIRASSQAEDIAAWQGLVITPWLAALATNQRFARLDLPAIFDLLDIPTMTDKARVKARQTGTSARAIVVAEICDTLRAALDSKEHAA